MKKILLIFITIILFFSCSGQVIDKLKICDVKFESITGYDNVDSANIYCILGDKIFNSSRVDNCDSIIKDWLSKHFNAKITIVSTYGPVTTAPNSKMTYCWIIDENDTLNISLVKQGCFPSETMRRPLTWDEMDKKEKDTNSEKPDIKLYISDNDYNIFIRRILDAEKFAKDNKLGIWNRRH